MHDDTVMTPPNSHLKIILVLAADRRKSTDDLGIEAGHANDLKVRRERPGIYAYKLIKLS